MRSIALLVALVPAAAHADSFTVEAGVGVGEQLGITSPGAAVGVGGWITPRTALTVRAAALTLSPQPPAPSGVATIDAYRRTFAFFGPSLQYWFDDHIWLGAGVGVAAMFSDAGDLRGWGADLRAGYALGAFDVSLEVSPSYFPTGGGFNPVTAMSVSSTTTGVALLAGYQFR